MRLKPSLQEETMLRTYWRLFAVALVVTAAGCLLDNAEAPDLAGPSLRGRAIEIRAIPDQLISDGWSSSVIEAVLQGPNSERLSGANIFFDINGFVDLGNLAPLNGPRPGTVGVEATQVTATTDGNGVARARYWAPFRTDQPSDTVVTILAREEGTNFREVPFAQTDIFLRAADRPLPGPIPTPQPGCDEPTADVQLSGTCSGGEIEAGTPIFALGGGSAPTEPGAVITTFVFDWGDGTGTDVTSSSTESHVYGPSLIGRSVRVQLTVVNSCGASGSATASDAEVVAACPTTSTCPTPSATLAVSGICATGQILVGAATNFDGSASSAGTGATIASYSWSFGDGGTGSGASTPHTYTSGAGLSRTVILTVRNSCGATDTDSRAFNLVAVCP
jgi:hypothetical protein